MNDDTGSLKNGLQDDDGELSDKALAEMLDGLLGTEEDSVPSAKPGLADTNDDEEEDRISRVLTPRQEAAEDAADSLKVELDIEDAPFLEEEEPEDAPQPEKSNPALQKNKAAQGEAEKKGLRGVLRKLLGNKKRLGLVAGAAIFLLLAPIGFLLLTNNRTALPPPEPAQSSAPPAAPEKAPEASPPPPLPDRRYVFESAPYLVPLRGSEGEPRFLHLRYTVETENPSVFSELQARSIPIRDAVYHYLSKKPPTLLSNEEQVKLLRSDLINVINQLLGTDKITELNFQEYLITGG